jgi:hypothetical protein
MAEDKKPAAKAKKIVDVAQPDTSAPSPNSKSVIITHHQTVQDPTITTEQPTEGKEPDGTAVTGSRSKHTVLQPLISSPVAEPEMPEAPTEPVAPEAPPEIAEDTPTVEPEPTPEPMMSTPKSPPTSASSDAQVGTKDIQTDAELASAEDVEEKRQTDLQTLADSKKYYLPIDTAERQRTRQFIASGILLSIILGASWLDIALDAGLIHIGHLHALTHFFN